MVAARPANLAASALGDELLLNSPDKSRNFQADVVEIVAVPRQNSILGRAGTPSSTVGAYHTLVVPDRAKRRTVLSRAIEVKQFVEDGAEAHVRQMFRELPARVG
jgi:hypothetical protein